VFWFRWYFLIDTDLTGFFCCCKLIFLAQKEMLCFENPSNILCWPDCPVNVRRQTLILALVYSDFPQLARDVHRYLPLPTTTVKFIKLFFSYLRSSSLNPHPEIATKYCSYFHSNQNWEFCHKLVVSYWIHGGFKHKKEHVFYIHICSAIILFVCVWDAHLLHCS
jgi:hypothetical protein